MATVNGAAMTIGVHVSLRIYVFKFGEKIFKREKSLARLIKKNGEKTQIKSELDEEKWERGGDSIWGALHCRDP